jgi:hypothetical protein
MASAITVEHCIFCPRRDLTEEHIVADWVLRAFVKSRRPTDALAGTFTAPTA